jgi:hypothetical protein
MLDEIGRNLVLIGGDNGEILNGSDNFVVVELASAVFPDVWIISLTLESARFLQVLKGSGHQSTIASSITSVVFITLQDMYYVSEKIISISFYFF